jgi:hypothetical protein
MKKVLVEHVSDDIRAVAQNSNVEQQKTLVTARALADIFSGDAFDKTRSMDAKYFTGDDVDLNKLTDSCIRYVEKDKYVNGPDSISYSGLITVSSVLAGGTLSWDADKNATRDGEPTSIRQIIYPEDLDDFTAYTRVGIYKHGVWSFSLWLPLGGQMLRICVTEATKAGLLTGPSAKLRPNVIYELHCSASEIKLPDANTFPTGTKIVFEQYPGDAVKDGSGNVVVSPRKSQITYTEKDETGASQTYATYAIPALDKIRTSAEDYRESGAWYENSVGAVQYPFEVVDLEKSYTPPGGTLVSRTWLLDVDQDAVARTGDLAALIDAHTDQSLADVVRYNSRTIRDADKANEIVISRQATFAGTFKLTITPQTGKTFSQLTDGFSFKAYLVNENSDGTSTDPSVYDWIEVSRGASLDPTLRYYYNDVSGKKLLAGVGGFVADWDDINADILFVKKYVGANLESAASSSVTIAPFAGMPSPDALKINCEFSKADLVRYGLFEGYIRANRNTTLVIVIDSNNHLLDKTVIIPSVTFEPNPHDSYIEKSNINSTALTSAELEALAKKGRPSEMVTSADIVAKIYTDIVSKLQKKGMFFGPRPIPTTAEKDGSITRVVANFNAAIEPGIYTINAMAGWNGKNGVDSRNFGIGNPDIIGYPIEIEGSTAPGGSNACISNAVLHVYRSDVYPDNMLKETDAANASRFTRITQVFYGDLNRINPEGVVPDGNAHEAAPLVSVRYGTVKGSTVTWSHWVRLTKEKWVAWCYVAKKDATNYVKNVDGSYTLTKNQIVEWMRVSHDFNLGNETGSKILLTVELPEPSPELIDLTFDVSSNITPTFTYTRKGVAEPYTFSAPENMVEGANKARFVFSSDRDLWYLVTAG